MSDQENNEPPCLSRHFNKWEVQPQFGQIITVNVCGDQFVMIDKLFGPQCSSKIRVKHDLETCMWVVEERNFNNDTWIERARFDAQEFYKDEYKPKETK